MSAMRVTGPRDAAGERQRRRPAISGHRRPAEVEPGERHLDDALRPAKRLEHRSALHFANYPTALNPATGGCRNITGRHNYDGTVTIYAITSTVSANGDTGADPNKLVKVTDRVSDTTLPTGDGDNDRDDAIGRFITLRSAQAGEVFRGVAFAPRSRDEGNDR